MVKDRARVHEPLLDRLLLFVALSLNEAESEIVGEAETDNDNVPVLD